MRRVSYWLDVAFLAVIALTGSRWLLLRLMRYTVIIFMTVTILGFIISMIPD